MRVGTSGSDEFAAVQCTIEAFEASISAADVAGASPVEPLYARIGGLARPALEVAFKLRQAIEAPAGDGVLLHIADAV